MLATASLSKEYIGSANFVDVDGNSPPAWFGIEWVPNYRGRPTRVGERLPTPNLIFLTDKGEYMCTVTGAFNSYNHALNVIREVKGDKGRYQASVERRECAGSQV